MWGPLDTTRWMNQPIHIPGPETINNANPHDHLILEQKVEENPFFFFGTSPLQQEGARPPHDHESYVGNAKM